MKSGNEEKTNNGWEAMGKMYDWITPQPLSLAERAVYLAIARRTVGYVQYTSDITSYAELAKLSGVSLGSIKVIVPKLIDSGYIIKVATNQIANVGKLAYRYQLNMQLPGFPSLGTLRSNKEDPITKSPKKKALTAQEKLVIQAQMRKEKD